MHTRQSSNKNHGMRPLLISLLVSYFVIDHGEGLYLSPMINDGSIEKARNLSRVDPEALGFNITSHSGFITVDEKYDSNLWFWYFPAGKVDTNIAPFIIWLQGGPGNPGMKGLFGGVGPFTADMEGEDLTENPHSWHNDHNLLFIDNPVGTGYSFTNHSDGYATNQTQIAESLYVFLIQFLKLFPELKTVPLYLAGQSYGGKHVPSLAYEIHKNNPTGEFKINLKGLAIGNGFYDPPNSVEGYGELLYQIGYIDYQDKKKIELIEEEFEKAMAEKDYNAAKLKSFDVLEYLHIRYPLFDFYDFTKEETLHWTEPFYEFATRVNMDTILHTDDSTFHYNNDIIDKKLGDDFIRTGKHWLEKSLDHYKTLLYTGQLDLVCPYPMAVRIHKNLNWNGTENYANTERYPWYIGNKLVGFSKKVGNMLEVLIRNAGHDVPADQPERTLLLIKSFINDVPLNDKVEYY